MIFNGEKQDAFPPKLETGWLSSFTILIQPLTVSSSNVVKQKEELKSYRLGLKKIKLLSFTDYVNIYTDHSKDSTKCFQI